MKSGIYAIYNKEDGKIYIGQSVYVNRRISDHKRLLNKGLHKNEYLQRSYTKRPEQFEFKVLELCEKQELDDKEKYWISFFESDKRSNGYNIESGGHDGNTWNDDARERRSGYGNPMFGKNHTKVAVEKIRNKNRGRNNILIDSQVSDIKQRLADGESETALADEYKVKTSTINKIFVCKNWEWIHPELNSRLLWLKENKNTERNRQLIEEYKSGSSVSEICKKHQYSECLVRKALGDVLRQGIEKNNHNRKSTIEAVRADFAKGMSKSDIMAKHKISNTSYIRYTSDLFNKSKEEVKTKCIEMRKSGMKVKDIADALGLHRTTVTEYTKDLVHANTEGLRID